MKAKIKFRHFMHQFSSIFLLYAIAIIVFGHIDTAKKKADLCVVFGSKVHADGTPSKRLKARLDRAAFLFQKGLCGHILVSGATGKEGVNEAEAMRTYLLAQGISGDNIFVDGRGVDTMKTARNARQLMQQNGYKSAVLVSQYFHLARTKLAFRKAGIKATLHSRARYYSIRDVYSIVREMVALPVYLVL
ncbi:MAG: YdcF family protein [Verrucomicrobiota bacterium]